MYKQGLQILREGMRCLRSGDNRRDSKRQGDGKLLSRHELSRDYCL